MNSKRGGEQDVAAHGSKRGGEQDGGAGGGSGGASAIHGSSSAARLRRILCGRSPEAGRAPRPRCQGARSWSARATRWSCARRNRTMRSRGARLLALARRSGGAAGRTLWPVVRETRPAGGRGWRRGVQALDEGRCQLTGRACAVGEARPCHRWGCKGLQSV